MNETDLIVAATRLFGDADGAIAGVQGKKAELEEIAAAVTADRVAVEAALMQIAALTGPANGTVLAAEGASFTVSGMSRVVRFGAGTGWRTATLAPGTYTCQLSTFNSTSDPAELQVKQCVAGPYPG